MIGIEMEMPWSCAECPLVVHLTMTTGEKKHMCIPLRRVVSIDWDDPDVYKPNKILVQLKSPNQQQEARENDCPLRALDDQGRAHSRWIDGGSGGGTCWWCEHCDETSDEGRTPFCPHCGAVMDGGPYEDLDTGPFEDK